MIDHPSDDPRGESCLILGYAEGCPIHIVCGYASTQSTRVITEDLPECFDRSKHKEGDLPSEK